MIKWGKSGAHYLLSRFISSGLSLIKRERIHYSREELLCCRFSFSQFGEDILLTDLYSGKKAGFYVDIGAYHPFKFSNTKLLYDSNWSGMNIDANPRHIRLFDRIRSRDINLCRAVSDGAYKKKYVRYPSAATNCLMDLDDEEQPNVLGERPIETTTVTTTTLNRLLDEFADRFESLDILNIDCEGEDFKIINSLNMDQWRPTVICIEAKGGHQEKEMINYLLSKNYVFHAKAKISLIFKSASFGS